MRDILSCCPVDSVLPELARALAGQGRAILTASPGSGKTTRVPLALAGLLAYGAPSHAPVAPLSGTILVLEPRRLAARAAARYMARLLGEEVGQRVGYRVRLESRVSKQTRVELLTDGMFTRRLLADPELSGVSCVIFDEFHERSLQADLGLALCLESAEAFRPDLRLVVMSATLDADEISRFLGGCPVIRAKGRLWPVQVDHAGRELTLLPGAGVEETAGKTARAVRETLRREEGSILVFLPGQAEIRRTASLLENPGHGVDIRPLYGNLPFREQDAAIAPSPAGRRKVVLATDLAQTSLTIEGVRIVIDAGLARTPRFEPATGLSKLVTGRVTRDAADQRAGRAGRLEPGTCLRLWKEGEHLFPQVRPEILDADLSGLFLDALVWGGDPAVLPWLNPPPRAALRSAAETLLGLDAIRPGPTGGYVLTAHGRLLARVPLHPRLAHMVLRAADLEGDLSSLAACLAAVVSEYDPLRKSNAAESGADIRLRLPLLRRPEHRRLRMAAQQIHGLCGLDSAFCLPETQKEDYSGLLLSLAWPERIAQRRAAGSFRLASGQGAELAPHDPLAGSPWLVAAQLGGGTNRRIYLAAPLTRDDLVRVHGRVAVQVEEVCWDVRAEAVVQRCVTRLGALVLEEKPLAPSSRLSARRQKAVVEGLLAVGLESLPWTGELRQLQARVGMLRALDQAASESDILWPDLSDAALLAGLAGDPESAWIFPWLEGVSRRAQFPSIDLGAALRARLPWPLPERLEHEAPERLRLPSGTCAPVDYLPALRGEPPVLAVKLQEMFGQTETPRVAGGRVALMLHLLSPAGRPLQITGDLGHFWKSAYQRVRAEMRGRYPRHPWPEDPLRAAPTGKTKKRLEAAGQ